MKEVPPVRVCVWQGRHESHWFCVGVCVCVCSCRIKDIQTLQYGCIKKNKKTHIDTKPDTSEGWAQPHLHFNSFVVMIYTPLICVFFTGTQQCCVFSCSYIPDFIPQASPSSTVSWSSSISVSRYQSLVHFKSAARILPHISPLLNHL